MQGVPVNRVVDTGANITIINGPAFKRVDAVAGLKKRDSRPQIRRNMVRSLLS